MKRSLRDNLAGILITVSIHLAVIIVLLLTVVEPKIKEQGASYELDFSKTDAQEKIEKEIERRKALNDRLEKMLRDNGVDAEPVRNVTVDRARLKDDRGTDAEKLYKDAERLAKELNQGYEVPNEENSAVLAKKNDTASHTDTQDRKYSGPSVISYELEGRKASTLPIPAYRCYGAGEVKVLISVNPSGTVISAKVDEASSSEDSCLRSFAVRAARLSKFSAKSDAPAKQSGYIIYSFVAQ